MPKRKEKYLFDNAGDLLRRTIWFRIRKINHYKVGMEHVR